MVQIFIWLMICAYFGSSIADRDCSQPPSSFTIFDCCHRQVLLNRYGPKCTEKMSSQLRASSSSPFTMCLSECIFQEGDLMTNTEIVVENAKRGFQTLYNTTPEFIPIMEAALERCDKIVKKTLDENKITIDLAEDMCHPVAAIVAQCTLIQAFISCPEPRWDDSDSCNDARDYLQTCRHSAFKIL